MRSAMVCPVLAIFLFSCNPDSITPLIANSAKKTKAVIPNFIAEVPKPAGYKSVGVSAKSFGYWLRNLPLRKDNILRLYDGSVKPNQMLHYAILDVDYNRNKLQQCADAVMRIRAEYLYQTKASSAISFLHQHGNYFTCSTNCSRKELELFLQNVFNWCGTYNLQEQLKPIANFTDIMPGDVLVKAGAPGHAMLVADVAENTRGEKMFLLLQSYMPAQEIHLVVNPYHPELSPWYSCNDSIIKTPGWQFKRTDLRQW